MSHERARHLITLCSGLAEGASKATMKSSQEQHTWYELAMLATAQQTATALQAIAEALLPDEADPS